MAQLLTWVVPFLAFLTTYRYLIRRRRRQEQPAEAQWGPLAAIVGCAGAAILLDYLL